MYHIQNVNKSEPLLTQNCLLSLTQSFAGCHKMKAVTCCRSNIYLLEWEMQFHNLYSILGTMWYYTNIKDSDFFPQLKLYNFLFRSQKNGDYNLLWFDSKHTINIAPAQSHTINLQKEYIELFNIRFCY